MQSDEACAPEVETPVVSCDEGRGEFRCPQRLNGKRRPPTQGVALGAPLCCDDRSHWYGFRRTRHITPKRQGLALVQTAFFQERKWGGAIRLWVSLGLTRTDIASARGLLVLTPRLVDDSSCPPPPPPARSAQPGQLLLLLPFIPWGSHTPLLPLETEPRLIISIPHARLHRVL